MTPPPQPPKEQRYKTIVVHGLLLILFLLNVVIVITSHYRDDDDKRSDKHTINELTRRLAELEGRLSSMEQFDFFGLKDDKQHGERSETREWHPGSATNRAVSTQGRQEGESVITKHEENGYDEHGRQLRRHRRPPHRAPPPAPAPAPAPSPPASDVIDVQRDFGALGDSLTDDTAALQAAIDRAATSSNSASHNSSMVYLPPGTYRTSSPLLIPAGVVVRGSGYGTSPLALQFDTGAVIAYCGTDYAVKIQGHNARLKDLAVYDYPYNNGNSGSNCDTVKAAGGVLLIADGQGLESVILDNVLIYFFLGGSALHLQSLNAGGIAYCSFYDLRIRHALRGVQLSADATSFTNSNSFWNGAISGEMTETAVLAEGPGSCNDNKFWSTVIEPPKTAQGHVLVRGDKTHIAMQNVRLEGTSQDENTPLVNIAAESYDNILEGLIGHTNLRVNYESNPRVKLHTNKGVSVAASPLNVFSNAAFHGASDGTSLPGWIITNDAVRTWQVTSVGPPIPQHNVLQVTHTGAITNVVELKPSAGMEIPEVHTHCSFGIYAKTSTADAFIATMKHAVGSTIASSHHSGSGNWEWVGMSVPFSQAQGPLPSFFIKASVELAAPSFHWGSRDVIPGASVMSTAGGSMTGTLTTGYVTVVPPATGNFWVFPREGNVFRVDTTNRIMQRINDSTADRFVRGTVITILFTADNVNVIDSVYIDLLTAFGSTAGSSLTLISNGDGTWAELNRNKL